MYQDQQTIKMTFFRSVAATPRIAIAASALPTALALSSLSSFSQSSQQNSKSQNLSFLSVSSSPLFSSICFGLVKNFARPPSAIIMRASTSDHKPTSHGDAILPELLTEFMVEMKCDGCVDAVKNKLQTVQGVKNVEMDWGNQVVRILGSTPVKMMTDALEQTGQKAKLIGQGIPEDVLVSSAVAELKGPNIFGVVRLAQVNMQLASIEASFSGLSPGNHGWSINEFGDLTRGAESTGKVFNPTAGGSEQEPLGNLGILNVDEKGEAFFLGTKENLRISDLIGRSVVVYETEDRSDMGLSAAVIARSAGVGENSRKLCSCDGTTIWESFTCKI